jgi:membrane dipeptidase
MLPRWFDAHLDLACLAALGRDMAGSLAHARVPWPPASVTLPALRDGHVTRFLATIFTEADGTDPGVSYPAGDAAAAHAAGVSQLEIYHAWQRAGLVQIEGVRGCTGERVKNTTPLRCSLLMECADPIKEPSQLAWWAARGVVAVGMAWGRGSRFAAGNSQDPATDPGVTPLGRDLVREMDRLNIVHDASHLSDKALDDLFSLTNATVIASHSNCRSLVARADIAHADLPESLRAHPHAQRIALQRHLADSTIREIARRGGVIGLNLYSPFLIPGAVRSRRATIDEALAHVDHVCTLAGHTRAVGLGSDMDGGFSGACLPEGINAPSDLRLLADGLVQRGWKRDDIENFTWRNWERVLAPPPLL